MPDEYDIRNDPAPTRHRKAVPIQKQTRADRRARRDGFNREWGLRGISASTVGASVLLLAGISTGAEFATNGGQGAPPIIVEHAHHHALTHRQPPTLHAAQPAVSGSGSNWTVGGVAPVFTSHPGLVLETRLLQPLKIVAGTVARPSLTLGPNAPIMVLPTQPLPSAPHHTPAKNPTIIALPGSSTPAVSASPSVPSPPAAAPLPPLATPAPVAPVPSPQPSGSVLGAAPVTPQSPTVPQSSDPTTSGGHGGQGDSAPAVPPKSGGSGTGGSSGHAEPQPPPKTPPNAPVSPAPAAPSAPSTPPPSTPASTSTPAPTPPTTTTTTTTTTTPVVTAKQPPDQPPPPSPAPATGSGSSNPSPPDSASNSAPAAPSAPNTPPAASPPQQVQSTPPTPAPSAPAPPPPPPPPPPPAPAAPSAPTTWGPSTSTPDTVVVKKPAGNWSTSGNVTRGDPVKKASLQDSILLVSLIGAGIGGIIALDRRWRGLDWRSGR